MKILYVTSKSYVCIGTISGLEPSGNMPQPKMTKIFDTMRTASSDLNGLKHA